MSKWHSLEIHRGCVNTISWDETGQYLLSGSDDHRLIITEPHSKKIYIGKNQVVPLAIKKQLFSTPKAGSLFASEMRSLAEWDWLTSYMISGSLYIGNVQYFVNLTLPNLYLFQNFLLFQFLKFGLTDFENGRFFLFRDPSWWNWWLEKVGKSY